MQEFHHALLTILVLVAIQCEQIGPQHSLSSELLFMFYVHVGIAIRFGTFDFGAHRALIATKCEQIGGVLGA